MSNPYVLITKDSFTLAADGMSKTVNVDNPDFAKLIEMYKASDFSALNNYLVELKKKVDPYKDKGFAVFEDRVMVNGEFLPRVLAERLKNHSDQGLPVDRLLKFWNNIRENTSFNSIEALYPFIEKNNCPLTADGCFVAYKSVREDFMDKYSGTVDNTPGKTVEKDRRTVDDDRQTACSYGLHVGGLTYPSTYRASGDKLVEVIVNPADVVSVPHNSYIDKIRVCKYVVAREIPWGSEYKNVELYPLDNDDLITDNGCDDDWDDDDEDNCGVPGCQYCK